MTATASTTNGLVVRLTPPKNQRLKTCPVAAAAAAAARRYRRRIFRCLTDITDIGASPLRCAQITVCSPVVVVVVVVGGRMQGHARTRRERF